MTHERVSCGNCNILLELPEGLAIERSMCPRCCQPIRRSPNDGFAARESFSRSNIAVAQPLGNARPVPRAPASLAPNLQDKKPAFTSSLFLIGGLSALILGLTIAIVSGWNSESAKQTPDDSGGIILSIQNDVDRLQAELDASRLQLDRERRINEKLEQERTDLLLELNKLEKATSF